MGAEGRNAQGDVIVLQEPASSLRDRALWGRRQPPPGVTAHKGGRDGRQLVELELLVLLPEL